MPVKNTPKRAPSQLVLARPQNFIQSIRKARDLTQDDLADEAQAEAHRRGWDHLNFDRTVILRLESRKVPLRHDHIAILCSVLKCNPNQLLRDALGSNRAATDDQQSGRHANESALQEKVLHLQQENKRLQDDKDRLELEIRERRDRLLDRALALSEAAQRTNAQLIDDLRARTGGRGANGG